MEKIYGIEKICPRCRSRFSICQHCWHGQKYCSSLCSQASRQEKLRINNQRYASSKKGRIHGRLRQQKYRSKNKTIKNVTDQSTNNSEHRLNSVAKISQKAPFNGCCSHCGKKITNLRRVSEMSDQANFNYSFRAYLKARERRW